MTDSVVAEGHVKMRDGKKWKDRWVVLRKPSPVADCLVLQVFKERGVKERSSVVLEHICGLEVGVSGEGVTFTLTILCLTNTAQLGFDSKEALLSWDLRLRYCLGEVHSFNVIVLPGTKLESGPATLHLCNHLLVIARDRSPVITGQWNLLDLRRYGPVTNGFVFEGGTRCGYWAGVFFLSCAEGEEISFMFDCIVRGISPSRGLFGLKPLMPEPSANVALAEVRLDQEAAELEKRLTLLSHCTASSSGSSAAGDDHSMSGSSHSDTSHSDSIVGGLLTQWTEPAPPILADMSLPSAARMAPHGEGKLSVNVVCVPRVPSKPAPLQRLQAIGWQSSSDSGIATASHSSYSSSVSSYTASLETGSLRGEYSSLLSLLSPPIPAKNLCTCSTIHTQEYQAPCSLRYLYNTPRSLLQLSRSPDEDAGRSRRPARQPVEFSAGEQGDKPLEDQAGVSAPSLCIPELPQDSAPSLPRRHSSSCMIPQPECLTCSPSPAASKVLFTTCPVCTGLKRAPIPVAVATVHSATSDITSAGEKSASLTTGTTDPPTNQEKKNQMESSASSALTNHSRGNLLFEEKSSPKCYIDSLSELLGHYCSGKADVALDLPGLTCSLEHFGRLGNESLGPIRTSLYEQMSSALVSSPSPVPRGPGLPVPSNHPSHSPIYENCLQCRRGQSGCVLPAVVPPDVRDVSAQAEVPWSRRGQAVRPLHPQNVDAGPTRLSSENQSAEEPPEASMVSSQPHEQLRDVEPTEEDEEPKSLMERDGMDPTYKITEGRGTDRNSELEGKSRNELMSRCKQQRVLRHGEGVDGPRGEGVTNVNIPHNPTARTQLH